MSDSPSSHSVIRSGIKLFGSQFLQNVFLLGIGVYFAHILSKDEMAMVSLFFLFTTVTPTLASLGLIDFLLRKLPECLISPDRSEANSLVKTILTIQLVLSFLISMVMVVFSGQLSMMFLKTDAYSFQMKIVGIGSFINSLIVFFDAVIRSMQLFGKLAQSKIMANVISRIFALLMFFVMGFNGYLGGLLLGSVLTLLIMVYYTRDVLSVRAVFQKDFIGMIKFSSPYFMSNIMRYLLINMDKFVIGLFLTPAHLATYFVASRLVEYLKQIIDSMMNPIFPKIAEFKADRIERVEGAFYKAFRYMAFLFIPLSIGGAALSYPLIYLYGGAKYTDGTAVMAILFVSMIGYAYTGLLGINIHVLGTPGEKMKIDVAGGVLNVVLSLAFVYPFGTVGIAMAKLAAFAGSVVIGQVIISRIIKLKVDLKAAGLSFYASVIMALVIVIPQIFFDELRIVPVHVLAGVAVFFIIIFPKLQQADKDLVNAFIPQKLRWLTRS